MDFSQSPQFYQPQAPYLAFLETDNILPPSFPRGLAGVGTSAVIVTPPTWRACAHHLGHDIVAIHPVAYKVYEQLVDDCMHILQLPGRRMYHPIGDGDAHGLLRAFTDLSRMIDWMRRHTEDVPQSQGFRERDFCMIQAHFRRRILQIRAYARWAKAVMMPNSLFQGSIGAFCANIAEATMLARRGLVSYVLLSPAEYAYLPSRLLRIVSIQPPNPSATLDDRYERRYPHLPLTEGLHFFGSFRFVYAPPLPAPGSLSGRAVFDRFLAFSILTTLYTPAEDDLPNAAFQAQTEERNAYDQFFDPHKKPILTSVQRTGAHRIAGTFTNLAPLIQKANDERERVTSFPLQPNLGPSLPAPGSTRAHFAGIDSLDGRVVLLHDRVDAPCHIPFNYGTKFIIPPTNVVLCIMLTNHRERERRKAMEKWLLFRQVYVEYVERNIGIPEGGEIALGVDGYPAGEWKEWFKGYTWDSSSDKYHGHFISGLPKDAPFYLKRPDAPLLGGQHVSDEIIMSWKQSISDIDNPLKEHLVIHDLECLAFVVDFVVHDERVYAYGLDNEEQYNVRVAQREKFLSLSIPHSTTPRDDRAQWLDCFAGIAVNWPNSEKEMVEKLRAIVNQDAHFEQQSMGSLAKIETTILAFYRWSHATHNCGRPPRGPTYDPPAVEGLVSLPKIKYPYSMRLKYKVSST